MLSAAGISDLPKQDFRSFLLQLTADISALVANGTVAVVVAGACTVAVIGAVIGVGRGACVGSIIFWLSSIVVGCGHRIYQRQAQEEIFIAVDGGWWHVLVMLYWNRQGHA